MSFLNTIAKHLPASKRAVAQTLNEVKMLREHVDVLYGQLYARIEQADYGINDNLNYKVGTRENLSQRLSSAFSCRYHPPREALDYCRKVAHSL